MRRALLLLLALALLTAVPAFAAGWRPPADRQGLPPSDAGDLPAGGTDGTLFDPQLVAETAAETEARREWIHSSEARTQRRATRDAYRGMGATDARRLLAQQFRGVVMRPNFPLSANDVTSYLTNHVATVRSAGGKRQLVYSSLPLRVEENGRETPVDLSLQTSDNGIAPAHPQVPLELPSDASGRIVLGREGLRIGLEGGPRAARASVIEDKAFYSEVATDTDLLLAPQPAGLEISTMLRSAASPETQRFHLGLPAGADIHSRADGGADIRGPEGLNVRIHAPSASDAQGQHVPVKMFVDGDSLTLRIDHRGGDYAYPILVDPVLEDWASVASNAWYWNSAADMTGWYFAESTAGYFPSYQSCPNVSGLACYGQKGLYIFGYYASTYPAGAYGEWLWQTRNQNVSGSPASTTYMTRAEFGWAYLNYYGDLGNDAQLWEGIYSSRQHAYTALDRFPQLGNSTYGADVEYDYNTVQPGDNCFRDGRQGSHIDYSCSTISNPDTLGGNMAVFAMLLPTARYRANWTEAYFGGGILYLADPEAPTIGTPTHTNGAIPGGWITSGMSDTVGSHLTDPGLGLKQFWVTGPDGGVLGSVVRAGCTGDRKAPCNNASDPTVTYSAAKNSNGFVEGSNTVTANATDILGDAGDLTHKRSVSWNVNIDDTAPTLDTPTGSLYSPGGVVGPGAQVNATARDGGSGARTIKFSVENGAGEQYPPTPSCNAASPCQPSLTHTFTLPSGLSEGTHPISLTATDAVNHPTAQATTWSVIFDSQPPVLGSVTHSNLPSGWTDSAQPSVSLAATDNGSGVQSYKLYLPRNQVVTKTYCSGPPSSPCPAAPGTYTFDYDSEQEPDGAAMPEGDNTLSLRAWDAANHSAAASDWHLKLDRTAPDIALSGTMYDNRGATPQPDGTYTLQVQATDGSTASASAQRSGVATVDIWIDGRMASHNAQGCATGSCALQTSFSFDTAAYLPGPHLVEVYSTDQVSHRGKQSFVFTTSGCCSGSVFPWGVPAANQVRFGDVNGDGLADMVSLNTVTNALSVQLSTGSQFQAAQAWGTWQRGADFYLADASGDGLADVVGANTPGKFYRADSTGTTFASPVQVGGSRSGTEYNFADFDGDGIADLISRNPLNGALTVSYNTGTGWEGARSMPATPAGGTMYFADVDASGTDDLILSDASGNLSVRLSDGTTYGSASTWGQIPVGSDADFADMNGDTAADLVTYDRFSGEVKVGLSDASAAFSSLQHWATLPAQQTFVARDLDGDIKADSLVYSPTSIQSARTRVATPVVPESAPWSPDPAIPYDLEDPLSPADSTNASASSSNQMLLAWQDDFELLQAYQPGGGGDAQFKRSADRIAQTGAEVVRMNVYWGRWLNNTNGYVQALDQAITKATSAPWNFKVWLTLTGGSPNLDAPFPPGTPSVDSPNPGGATSDTTSGDLAAGLFTAGYGKFATAVATRYSARTAPSGSTPDGPCQTAGHCVDLFSVWNEPNLAHKNNWFLRVSCPDGSRLTTGARYRELYDQAWTSIRAAAPKARIYAGELSQEAQSGRTNCGSSARERLNAADYLKQVVNANSAPMKTNGIAWHPYQHYVPPESSRDSHGIGIGKIATMQRRIDTLFAKGASTHPLQTPSGKRPLLYGTEFGYFMDSTGATATTKKPAGSVHTEAERAEWYMGALDQARYASSRPARSFLIYETLEKPGVYFDTGLMGPDPNDPSRAIVDGQRTYGKGAPVNRKAYCAIWLWAGLTGYKYQNSDCSGVLMP